MDDARNIGEGAFIRAFAKHEPALRAYARALLPDWDAVDEALQEASVVMWRKIGQLQAEEEFLPWAKVVLRFEVLKTRRKYARDRHVFSEALINMLADEGVEQEQPSTARQKALEQCLQKLSAPNRELVMAPYEADNAVTEIAQRADRTVNSLYKLLGRLRLKLRDCVEGKLADFELEGVVT